MALEAAQTNFSWIASFSASWPTPSVSFLRVRSFVDEREELLSMEGVAEGSSEDGGRDVFVAAVDCTGTGPELKRPHHDEVVVCGFDLTM
jgi:hypothetical protein